MRSTQKPPTVSDDYRAVDIYRRAADIIHAQGFNATSMGDIADAVDLTKGGLYYYIKGKKALLFAIMDYAMGRLETEVLTRAEGQTQPQTRLATLVSGHLGVVLSDPSALSILVDEEENLGDEHRSKIVERKQRYSMVLRTAIHDADDGGDGSIDPSVAAFSILGMIHGVVRWYQPRGRLSQQDLVAQMTHFVLRGLATPVAGAPKVDPGLADFSLIDP